MQELKKGVTLTDNGRMLMPYIQEMTNQKDKLRQAAFNINHKIEGNSEEKLFQCNCNVDAGSDPLF